MSAKPPQSGKILLIGASGGVGKSLMRQLADGGYQVLGSALNQPDLDGMVAAGFDASTLFVADFSSAETGVAQVRDALKRNDAPLMAVISCIGVNPAGALETTPLEVFRRTMEINAISNLALYQATLPQLRQNKGRLILVSSMSGKVAFPLLGYYTASKFALEGLADTMRLEAGQWGVPVTVIEPGAIATAMVHDFARTLDDRVAQLDEQGRQNYGDYFAQFRALTEGSDTSAISPDIVAQAIVNVLEAEEPETRVAVGNAVELLEMRQSSTDKQMDAVFNQMFPGLRPASQSA